MELTEKQQLTIKHFKKHLKLETPEQIIEHCKMKMALPRRGHKDKRSETRNHTVEYYQAIIDYLRG